jgi:DNA-binding MarR family transcriptional regulator
MSGFAPSGTRLMTRTGSTPLTKAEFEALSEFRYQLRRFERFSEDAVQASGITPLQYLLLLHVKGTRGREHATVGELAQRLQAKPHGVVALVTRCERNGFVRRRASEVDRRQVEVHLTPAGERLLRHLAEVHRAELRTLPDVFPIPAINR